jgi:hypothetical protein
MRRVWFLGRGSVGLDGTEALAAEKTRKNRDAELQAATWNCDEAGASVLQPRTAVLPEQARAIINNDDF